MVSKLQPEILRVGLKKIIAAERKLPNGILQAKQNFIF